VKILILNKHPSVSIGGSEIQCDLLASGLVERGHAVHYGAFGGVASGRSFPYPCAALSHRDADCLGELLEHVDPELVYWRFNLRRFLRAAKVIHRHGPKLVFGVSHETDVQKLPRFSRRPSLRRSLRHLVNYQGYRYVDGLISLNPDLLGQVPVRRQVHIPNMMEEAARPFSWPAPFIAWVANMKERKRPERFIELAARLHDAGLGVDCLMVGEIQSKTYRFIEDPARTPANLHYLGAKDPLEVNGILQQSLFLVHTCQAEGFGNVFIQSWLQGKPTLSLDYDPNGVIEREMLGRLCGTMNRLFEETKTLIGDEARRRAIGERARDYARKNHAPELNLSRFEAFFEEVLRTRRRVK
jgi:glycosyltransferase involved in cell wall biosynthesis